MYGFFPNHIYDLNPNLCGNDNRIRIKDNKVESRIQVIESSVCGYLYYRSFGELSDFLVCGF